MTRARTAPHHYYGWVLVGALGITETISWGVLYYAFSAFVTPMEADLGWSRAETTVPSRWRRALRVRRHPGRPLAG